MRLDGGTSVSGMRDVADMLPPHFTNSYPYLVEFLEAYVTNLYSSRLGPEQLSLFLSDESWWDKSNYQFDSPEDRQFQKIVDLQKFRERFGISSGPVNLIENKSLERPKVGIDLLDGYVLSSSDDFTFEVSDESQFHIKSWLKDKGLDSLSDLSERDISLDLNLFIKLARHLYKIRGSMECARIFFESVYGGSVYTEFPRDKISTLDDNFVLDGTNFLRDDLEYDEFSYVVNLVGSKYNEIGSKYVDLWLEAFHPAGFRCLFRTYTDIEWSLVSGNAERFPSLINVWKEFFEGPFAQTMIGIQNG